MWLMSLCLTWDWVVGGELRGRLGAGGNAGNWASDMVTPGELSPSGHVGHGPMETGRYPWGSHTFQGHPDGAVRIKLMN